jgi:hypothetical protein
MEASGVMLLNHKDGTRRDWVVFLHMEIIGPGDAKRIVQYAEDEEPPCIPRWFVYFN